jgi:hypothetical protein
MFILWRPLRAIPLVVESGRVKGRGRRRQRLEAQLHLIAFVFRNGILAVVVVTIAALGLKITVL